MNKKGITLIEILVTIAILAVAILSIFIFNTKVKNKTTTENNMIDVFYNNVSAFEIIQKTLNETGSIDAAISKAIEETKGVSGRYVKSLEVEVNPVVIYPNNLNISDIDPLAEEVINEKTGETECYQNGSVLYYSSGVVSPNFNLSYSVPIYKIKINTYLGIKKWDNLEISTLVSPHGGINVYEK